MNRSAHLYALRLVVFAGFFFSVGVAFAVVVQALLAGVGA